MRYNSPDRVLSPRDFLENVEVIYDGGSGENPNDTGFSLARLTWEGNIALGIRWNVARREWDSPEKINNSIECVGMPSSHGYPVWFVIPDELLDSNSEIWEFIRDKFLK
ncbi:MAG: hypothetical protein Q8861_07705 [Bacteroidota bacterium]|nr:hypothetical protein [Bacteroidota bacterium]